MLAVTKSIGKQKRSGRQQKRNMLLEYCARKSFLSSSSLLTTALMLSTLLLSRTHAFTLLIESSQRDCIDIVCDEDAFSSIQFTLVREDGQTVEECRACQQCTNNGYSVCAQPRTYNREKNAFVSSNRGCECAHSIPTSCKIPSKVTSKWSKAKAIYANMLPESSLFNLCYLSVLQKPPAPLAVNDLGDVLLSIQPFWLTDYWKFLKLKKLTIFYKFPVTMPSHCGGRLTPIPPDYYSSSFQSTEGSVELAKIPEYICNASFRISMYSQDEVKEDEEYKNDVYDYENEELPPEVQFERDVFMGAKQAKFYYQIMIVRPNQLEFNAGGPANFENKTTLIESEEISFDLEYSGRATQSEEDDRFNKNQKSTISLVKPATSTTQRMTTKSRRERPTPITPKSANQLTITEAAESVDHHKISKVDIVKHSLSDSAKLDVTFVDTTTVPSANKITEAYFSGDILPSSNTASTSADTEVNSHILSTDQESSTIAPHTDSTPPFTSPVLEKHLNSGGQYKLVRNVFLSTLLLCGLLVFCICGYRHSWFSYICVGVETSSGDTKNVNGKEYLAAPSNADANHKSS